MLGKKQASCPNKAMTIGVGKQKGLLILQMSLLVFYQIRAATYHISYVTGLVSRKACYSQYK